MLMRRRIDLVDVGKLTGHLDFRAGRNERSEQYQPNGVAKRRWSVEKEVANGAEEVAAARRGLNTRVIFLAPGKNTEQMSQGLFQCNASLCDEAWLKSPVDSTTSIRGERSLLFDENKDPGIPQHC
ncbi:MAG: hypothetical protein ACXWNJ_17480 [Vulcanimicrobiaceae bacterium]